MSSIKKQGIQNAVITYIGVVIGFVSLLFIQPNLLKPEELGLTRILIAAASLIATILPLGVSGVTTKFFPFFRNSEKKHYGYFGFMLLFPVAGTLLCGILIYLFKQPIIEQYVNQSFLFTRFFHLLLPFAFIIGLNIALNAYTASLFKTTIISFLENIFTRVLFILLIVAYYFGWIDLMAFMNLYVTVYLLQSLTMIGYIYTVDKPSLKPDTAFLKSFGINKLVHYGMLLTLSNFASLGLKHLDTVLLGTYLNLSYVGIFAVCTYISLVIEIPLTSLEKITHSKVAEAWANKDMESIKSIYYQSVKYLLLATGLLAIGIIANINDLLSLLPEAYHQGSTVAVIACIGAFLNAATGVNTSILFGSEKYIYGTYLLMFLLVLAFTLNVILIPIYGINGAALATMLASVVYNVLKFIIIWKNYRLQPYTTNSLKIVGIIAVSFAAGVLVPAQGNVVVSIVLRSSVITLVYLGLTHFTGVMPELFDYLRKKRD